jgi:VanZ family protein
MNTNDSSPNRFSRHKVIHHLHIHGISLVSAAYVLYLLFGCWVPFDWSLTTADAIRPTFDLGRAESGTADIFTNVALYVPAGALFFVMSLSRGRGTKFSAIQALLLAASLSLAIEAGQKFLHTRFSSTTDWMCNTTGACIGILIAWFGRELILRGLNRYTHELEHHPVVAGTKLYAIFVLIVGISPFLPIYDMAHLIRVWKEASYIPFSELGHQRTAATTLLESGNIDAYWATMRDLWLMIVRWFFEAALFVCLGFAVCRSFIRQTRFGHVGSIGFACIVCFWLATALSVVQIFILTRGFYATDIVARTLGAVLGASVAGCFRREKDDTVTLSWAWRMRIAPVVVVTMLAIIVLNGIIPFAFELDMQRTEAQLWSPKVLPFYSYYIAKPYVAAADLLNKSIHYLILATALSGAWVNLRERTLKLRAIVIAGAACTIATALELSQVFNQGRIATLTDPVLATVAAVAGVTLEQYLTDLHAKFLEKNGDCEMQQVIQQSEMEASEILPNSQPGHDLQGSAAQRAKSEMPEGVGN